MNEGESATFGCIVSNAGGSVTSDEATLTVTAINHAPTAKASASPTSGIAPLTVNFSGQGSSDPDGDALRYAWNFGDGYFSSSAAPSHVYNRQGVFTATLTVYDGRGGTGKASITITVKARNVAPTCAITAPKNGSRFIAPASFTVSASAGDSDGEVAKVEFFVNNSKIGEDASAPYGYKISRLGRGTYNISAQATDNEGAVSKRSSISISVRTR